MKVLMCPPLYYEPAAGEDASAIMEEWRGLYRLLRDELDVQVDLLEPRPGMPGLVLAASGGVVWKDSFIAGQSREWSRRPESETWANFFLVRGYAMLVLPEGGCFEGERDLVAVDGALFAGHRSDDDLRVHRSLSEIHEHEVHSLRLSDEWDWPLDTCLCPLGGGNVLYYPDAFHPDTRRILHDKLRGLHSVDAGDARRLACNAMAANGKVILTEGCGPTARRLEQAGVQVHTVPLGAYARHGAGPKALVLRMEE